MTIILQGIGQPNWNCNLVLAQAQISKPNLTVALKIFVNLWNRLKLSNFHYYSKIIKIANKCFQTYRLMANRYVKLMANWCPIITSFWTKWFIFLLKLVSIFKTILKLKFWRFLCSFFSKLKIYLIWNKRFLKKLFLRRTSYPDKNQENLIWDSNYSLTALLNVHDVILLFS